jgi:hypothetical protein
MMFSRLILAHLLGDFVLQTRWLVVRKRSPGGLAMHVGIVGVAMLLVAWDRLAVWWPWLLAILAAHAVTDWTKIHLEARLKLPPIVPFLADQAVHVLIIAAVAALAGASGLEMAWNETDPGWWIASAYIAATFGLSIALPLWLDPSSVMQRPLVARVTIIFTSAVVLTLAWLGWPILIPLVGLVLYQVAARPLARSPLTKTFGIEFWSAVVMAATLGWGLV